MRIVVNADDFGFSADTVRATIDAVTAGHVTSATLMPKAPASDEAVDFARSTGGVSFGVHLVFVGDGDETPVSAPEDVAALVDRAGRLRRTNAVRLAALLGRLSVEDIAREIEAQVDWVRTRGIEISHVDSHRHLHKYGPFREALARVLPRLGIRSVRNVQDVYLRRPLASPTVWLGERWRAELMGQFETTDHLYMPASTGDEDWTALLHIPELEGSTIEVGVHPGELEEWRVREARGLAEFVPAAVAAGHELVSWFDV
jgi:hypothetical protein